MSYSVGLTCRYIDDDEIVLSLKKMDNDVKWPSLEEAWSSLTVGVSQLLKGTLRSIGPLQRSLPLVSSMLFLSWSFDVPGVLCLLTLHGIEVVHALCHWNILNSWSKFNIHMLTRICLVCTWRLTNECGWVHEWIRNVAVISC
jgi:hypothetical protein